MRRPGFRFAPSGLRSPNPPPGPIFTLDSHFFDDRARWWYGRNSTVGIAPGAHRAGRLHESDMYRAIASHMKASTWAAAGGSFHLENRRTALPRGGSPGCGIVDSLLF